MLNFVNQSKNKRIFLNKTSFNNLKLADAFCVKPDDFKFIVHDSPKSPNGSLFQKERVDFGINSLDDENILISEIINRIELSNNVFLFDHFSSSSEKVENVTNLIDTSKEFVFWYAKHNSEVEPLSMFIQGLRDSLCHGNIYLNNGLFLIFSTSSRDHNYIKFGLQINSLEKIHLIVEILKERLLKFGGIL